MSQPLWTLNKSITRILTLQGIIVYMMGSDIPLLKVSLVHGH